MTGSEIVKTAKKYKDRSGSYFCKQYGLNYTCDWCVIYLWYVFKAAKACKLFYNCNKVASVPLIDSWLRRNAKFIKNVKDAREGDIVIFTWSSKGGNNTRVGIRDHMGLVIDVLSSKEIKTIEGNTGSDDCRKSGVNYRVRPIKNIYAIYRPDYKEDVNIDDLVKKTLSGKYGTGEARKKALGSNYKKVQTKVNKIVDLTNKTLAGEYGTGAERKKKLGKNYDLVQWNINRIYEEKER